MSIENIPIDTSSILKEYLKYHIKYTDKYGEKTIILMMVGSFYECYSVHNESVQIGPDLQMFSNLLNIQVSRRNKNIPDINFHNWSLLGVPSISLIKYRDVLLNNGYTIVIVDQISAPPNPERKVTEIISPSTSIDIYDNKDSHFLLSFYINQYPTNTYENILMIGVSAIDISTGVNYVHKIQSSLKDTKLWKDEIYRITHNYNPSEILFHLCDNIISQEEIQSILCVESSKIHYQSIHIETIYQIQYQNDFLGKIFQSNSHLSPIEYLNFENEKEITLSYIYMIQFIYEHKIENIQNIQKPIVKENQKYLSLSYNCIHQLYITEAQEHKTEKYNSLLSILNICNTAIGRRLCKDRLLYPIINVDKINQRYDDIDLFMTRSNDVYIFEMLIPSLKKIIDIERLQRKISLQTIHPYEFFSLHYSYEYIKKIYNTLKISLSDYSSRYIKLFDSVHKYQEHYLSLFNINEIEKWSLQSIETSIFKKGVYPEIDEIDEDIKLKKERLEIIANQLGKYIDNKKDNLIKLSYTEKYGWHLHMTKNRGKIMMDCLKKINLHKIQFSYQQETFLTVIKNDINIITRGTDCHLILSYIDATSSSILSSNKKMQSLLKEKYIYHMKEIYDNYSETMIKLVSFIGEVDLCSNIAKLSIHNVYCRPEIKERDNQSYFMAKKIRHPIVEKIQTDIEYIPNDIELSEDGILLYGTNACGKSTLMKSVGLSIVMAQSGFFVPCESFIYYPYTQIFTRILNNDNMFKGLSSFAVEMSELRSLLIRGNERSLILGDELCSGTENISALSIVSAGLKTLNDMKCSFIFTSHLHQLMDIKEISQLERLKVYHMKIIYDKEKDILIYDRKLEKGSGPAIYGLEVCKAMGLDNDFISYARKIQIKITNESDKLISDKKSKYNSQLILDKCTICNKKEDNLETHHIKEQQNADKNNIIEHFHKNKKHNLVQLCKSCHYDVTFGKLRIDGYIQTNEGIKLKYNYVSENNQSVRKKKYSKEDIDTIFKYKEDILSMKIKKNHLIRKLELENGIKISIQTLNKIINNKY